MCDDVLNHQFLPGLSLEALEHRAYCILAAQGRGAHPFPNNVLDQVLQYGGLMAPAQCTGEILEQQYLWGIAAILCTDDPGHEVIRPSTTASGGRQFGAPRRESLQGRVCAAARTRK